VTYADRADGVAWRVFRGLSYDPHVDPADPPPKDQSGWYGLAALLSLLVVGLLLRGAVGHDEQASEAINGYL
jgi:hypothetical protein